MSDITSPYPCPYCGGKTKISGKSAKGHWNNERNGTMYYVICNSCKMRGPLFKGKRGDYENGAYVGGEDLARIKALDAWNILASK